MSGASRLFERDPSDGYLLTSEVASFRDKVVRGAVDWSAHEPFVQEAEVGSVHKVERTISLEDMDQKIRSTLRAEIVARDQPGAASPFDFDRGYVLIVNLAETDSTMLEGLRECHIQNLGDMSKEDRKKFERLELVCWSVKSFVFDSLVDTVTRRSFYELKDFSEIEVVHARVAVFNDLANDPRGIDGFSGFRDDDKRVVLRALGAIGTPEEILEG